MNSGKAIFGLLVGLAAGAALGVLFAPAKGTKTRRKIYRKGAQAVDDMVDKFDGTMETITDKFEALKKEATQMFEKGKAKTESVVADATAAVSSKMN